MTRLPNVYPGDPILARHQRELIRSARRKITGPNVIETIDGFHIRGPKVSRPITVVLVEAPASDAETLMVRRVREINDPPVPAGTYEWDGEPFEAYPDFGHTAEDYADFVLDGDLDINAMFHKAYRSRGVWRVEFAGEGGIKQRFVAVVEVRADYLLCKPQDDLFGDDIFVARPYLLRRTPFETTPTKTPKRNGTTYDYRGFDPRFPGNEDHRLFDDDDITRIAERESSERNAFWTIDDQGQRVKEREVQTIDPMYYTGLAEPGDTGPDIIRIVSVDPVALGMETRIPDTVADIEWVDANDDGRGWGVLWVDPLEQFVAISA